MPADHYEITEVHADAVRVGDEVWCSTGRYGGGPEGQWCATSIYDDTGTPFSGSHLALEGRGGPHVNPDSLIHVRRPVPPSPGVSDEAERAALRWLTEESDAWIENDDADAVIRGMLTAALPHLVSSSERTGEREDDDDVLGRALDDKTVREPTFEWRVVAECGRDNWESDWTPWTGDGEDIETIELAISGGQVSLGAETAQDISGFGYAAQVRKIGEGS